MATSFLRTAVVVSESSVIKKEAVIWREIVGGERELRWIRRRSDKIVNHQMLVQEFDRQARLCVCQARDQIYITLTGIKYIHKIIYKYTAIKIV